MNSGSMSEGFRVENVSFEAGGRAILSGLSLDLEPGLLHGIIGANGSGKSSLVKLLARQDVTSTGRIFFQGTALPSWGDRSFARSVAYLPQDPPVKVGLTVRELISFGRYPWHGSLGRFSQEDRDFVDRAIDMCGLGKLSGRIVDTLSGGERQRAWIAMTLAQNADMVILDEPTSALDIAHQIEVLSLVHRLAKEEGRSALMVLHDVNMAARYCDRLHALQNGRLIASGPAAQVMQSETLSRIYGIGMDVMMHPSLGVPVACPI